MANYRPVHVKIWSDPKFQDLPPKSKLVFLYLFTNEKVTESGIYPCTFRTISNETNIPVTEIEEIILNDLKCMISYDEENHIIWVKNFLRYNGRGRPEYVYRSICKDMDNTSTSLWQHFNKSYASYLEEFAKS